MQINHLNTAFALSKTVDDNQIKKVEPYLK